MHIISEIAPLYNSYQKETDPVKSIVLMWEIGKILDGYIMQLNIKPHALYRELYGKSETGRNTEQRSYISREFQGRCFRVYHMFKDTGEIRLKLKKLKNITIFREAMPFFDNDKYKVDRQQLYSILTADKSAAAILQDVKNLQNTVINKQNPRTQRLAEMKDSVEIFKSFYMYILSFIRMQEYNTSSQKFIDETGLTVVQTRELAKNTEQLVLTSVVHKPIIVQSISHNVDAYVKMIDEILTPGNIKKLRRFKRLVSSRYILLLTDMLYALTDNDTYQNLATKVNK